MNTHCTLQHAQLASGRGLISIFCGLVLGLSAPLAFAQTEDASTANSSDADTIEVITVVGSHLKVGNETSPVTVITKADLLAQGISTLEQALAVLPQNAVSRTSVTSLDGTSSRSSLGVGSANLRGFGSENTLVLVNGRRPAGSPSNLDRGANINSIPFAAIERIEVLTDGASAIYGADAVAGVINIVLVQGYDLPEVLSVRYDEGANGGDIMALEASFGTAWESGSLNGSVGYKKQDTILASAVGYSTRNFTSIGGPDFRFSNPQAAPGAINGADVTVDLGVLLPGVFPIGTFVTTPGAFYGGVDRSRDASVPVTVADFSISNLAPLDQVPQDVSAESEQVSAYLRFDQDVTDRFSMFAEANFSVSDNFAEASAPLVRDTLSVPTTNAFNATGEDLNVSTYQFDGEVAAGLIPRVSVKTETESFGVVLGGSLQLGFKDWSLEAILNHGKESQDTADFFSAIDANRFAAVLADSDPATALNLFGDGSQQNPATLQGLFVPSGIDEENTISQLQLVGSGTLFELPAGPVATAISIDLRNEETLFSVPGGESFGGRTPERDITAVFTEISLPLIGGDTSVSGIHSLELRVAARWEEYSVDATFDGEKIDTLFSNTSPSIGLAWYITPDFKIRANFGESFKAPQLEDLLLIDPNPTVTGFLDVLLAGAGATTDPVNGLPIVDLPLAFVGNPNLKPEVSDTQSFGFDWKPSGSLDGLTVSASYTEITTEDAVGNTFSLIFLAPDIYLTESVIRDEQGIITTYVAQPFNFSESGLRAADVALDYVFDTDWGMFDLGIAGTRTFEVYDQLFPTEERVRREGQQNGPDRTKARAWVGWARDSYGAQLSATYSSSYENEFITPDDPTPRIQKVDSYLTLDLTGRLELSNGFSFYGGVRNLADEDFPLYFNENGAPFDSRRVDVRGRTVYLEVRKSFDFL